MPQAEKNNTIRKTTGGVYAIVFISVWMSAIMMERQPNKSGFSSDKSDNSQKSCTPK